MRKTLAVNASPGPPPAPSPGPWTAAGPFAVLDAEGETVAACPGPRKAENQRRIAAAPALLDACRAAAQLLDDLDGAAAQLLDDLDGAAAQLLDSMDGAVRERYLTARGSEEVRFLLNDAIAQATLPAEESEAP